MTPDRMRGWLSKIPKGATMLELCADDKTTGTAELAVWERQEVVDLKGTEGDVADAIMQTAKDYTEGEEAKQQFLLRWHGKRGKILQSVTHWEKPSKPETTDDGSTSSMSDKIVKEVLKWSAAKDRAMLEHLKVSGDSYRAAADANEKTISMLTKRLDSALVAADEAELATSKAPTVVEVSEIAEAEIMQRTEALRALTEKLPDMIEMGITFIATKLLEKEDLQAAAAKAAAEAAQTAAAASDN